MSILTVGTVALDSIETAQGSVDAVLGGSATYIALAAKFFCEDVRLVAVVGNDFPDSYMHTLQNNAIDLEGLQVDKEGKTFAWGGRYHKDMIGRDTLFTDLNVLETFSPVIPDQYKDSRLICLGNLEPGIQRSVLEQIDQPHFVVCDTMNFWIDHTLESLKETLRYIHCLTINDEEARQLANESNLLKAAHKVLDMGPKVLVVKKGEHGAMLISKESMFLVPAFPLDDIQDPTGAGDTFMGGFVGYLSKFSTITDSALRQAVVYASTIASFSVERFGPDRLLGLTEAEIEARVSDFRQIIHVPVLSEISSLVES